MANQSSARFLNKLWGKNPISLHMLVSHPVGSVNMLERAEEQTKNLQSFLSSVFRLVYAMALPRIEDANNFSVFHNKHRKFMTF